MKRAVIYARYSTGPNQTDVSIEGQEKICNQYIERQGYVYAGLYADRHISGRTDQRPQFQQMVDDAKSGGFDVVVVYSLDRFSRDKYDSAIYKKALRNHDVVVESASESIPEGPEGILFEGMLEAMAEYYSAELSKKIRRGMDVKASKGMSVGGHTPFGYVLKDGTYEADPKTSPHVTDIFERFVAGDTLTECARYLTGLGFSGPHGGSFTSESIRRMLQNKKYTGRYIYNGIEIDDGMPRLVSDALFYKAQKKLGKKKPRRPRGEYALSGKLIHGPCGSDMIGTSGKGRSAVYFYYKCPKNDIRPVPRDLLEHAVAQHVREALSSPENVDGLVDKLLAYQEEERRTDVKTSALESNLKDLDRKIDRIVNEIADGGASRALRAKLDEYEADRAIMKEDLDKMSTGPILSRDVLRQSLQLSLLEAHVSDAKLIHIFVHRVVLYDDRLLIEFNFKGADELERSELLGFDLNSSWCTSPQLGRTMIVYHGRVLTSCKFDRV